MATYPQDSWSEVALISISQLDTNGTGTDVSFAAVTDNINIEVADKDIESKALLNGGRVTQFKPQEDTTITLEAYPLEAGTASGTSGKGFFDLMNGGINIDASQPLAVSASRRRWRTRIAVLWAADPSQASAHIATNSTYQALRVVAADGYITGVKPDYTDKHLKFTITYKVPAFDKDGNANIQMESTDGTAALPALATYSTSTKW